MVAGRSLCLPNRAQAVRSCCVVEYIASQSNLYLCSLSLSLSLSLILDANYRAIFIQAMAVWSEHTCIQFALAPSESDEHDHIVFIKSDTLG